ncbi:MAG: hypothetical protein II994_04700 [Lachnospiraceae bacterium]|nr:hypothetical protein [Lachnospiraceae bacterium]
MSFKKKCGKCTFEYEYEGFANLMTFCPKCNNYDFLECEYGYGPVVPCRICHGSKVIGMVTYSGDSERRYRIDSDIFNLHKVLEHSYLEALYEARDVFSELIKDS